MLGPACETAATFSYVVFGGSARMAHLLNTKPVGGDNHVFIEVMRELTEFLEDTEFSAETVLIQQAAFVISDQVASTTSHLSGQALAAAVRHSLFVHTYIAKTDSSGSGSVRACCASTFLGILAGVLLAQAHQSVLVQLKAILEGSGFGVLFEAQVHKLLYEKFRTGGELRLVRLYPSGYQRVATDRDHKNLQITVTRKVLIRRVEDLAKLPPNVYGMPIIPNFALIDAAIKVVEPPPLPPYGLQLQVTAAMSHTGAVDKHPAIETYMGTTGNMMIFCCCKENFGEFKYVDGLVSGVKQYKMLCEWEADPTHPAAKKLKTGGAGPN